LSGSKSDSLGILTDSRPLFNVSKEIYQLAADNINSWFSFLDNQIHKKSNFIAPSEFILEESNWKELRKKGITENEIFSIYEHARAIDGALNRLQKALDSKSIEVFEKNLYFILYNFAFVSGEQYFMKKLKPIVENSHLFKYSTVLPRYYISFENDQTLNSFIDEVLELDTENPIILIADAFRKMDDDSLNAEVNIKKALKSVILSNIPGKTTSIGYFILALIYQRRLNYRKAEIFFNQSLSYSMPNFLRAIIVLNRGQNRLDNNELLGAKKDFLESLEYPHTEASARTNLGKLYFIQNFLDKAEIELIKALEINPSFAAAYYNLGVLYSQRNDKGRAKKYFQLTLQADSKFVEARNNLEKLEQSTKPLTDWWFEDSSAFKKIVGSLTILLISALFIFAAYQLIIKMQNEFVNSYFIMIVFFIIFLMLPTLAKLKIGPVELDMKSVGSSAH
jgi:tetratricopeptide (TPR) repeat protein